MRLATKRRKAAGATGGASTARTSATGTTISAGNANDGHADDNDRIFHNGSDDNNYDDNNDDDPTTTKLQRRRQQRQQRQRKFGSNGRGIRSTRTVLMTAVIIVSVSWTIGFVAVYIWSLYYHNDSSTTSNNNNNNNILVKSKISSSNTVNGNFDSPLLIFTCQRDNYLRETLDTILQVIPPDCTFGCPIIVSEDGQHAPIESVVTEFQHKFMTQRNIPIVHLIHTQHLRRGVSPSTSAYVALAQHYKWALTKVFDGGFNYGGSITNDVNNDNVVIDYPQPSRVIILEEDIRVAPDFFSYMEATSKILDNDPTLLAVSAFNDNGHQGIIDSHRLLRSDFFPGLGWMMSRDLWTSELKVKWPDGYWDDWLRDPLQRKNRQVIRPEISRTYHFGRKGGASSNQFGSILERVKLNTDAVDWSKEDLTYLMPTEYESKYLDLVRHSQHATSVEEGLELVEHRNVVVSYAGFADFQSMARRLGLMTDEKAGVPRTSYKGIVETRPLDGQYFLFLAPIDVM